MTTLQHAQAVSRIHPIIPVDPETSTGGLAAPQDVLTFRVGQEEYAMDILRVQEIRSSGPITRIAHAPSTVLGVINLRGVIVPVIDLRRHLEATASCREEDAVTVIVDLNTRVVGTVVDSVSDVLTLKPDDVRPAPDLGRSHLTDAMLGLATLGDAEARRTLIVIDIERLLADAGLGA